MKVLTQIFAAAIIVVSIVFPANASAQELIRVPYVGGVTDSSGIVMVWLRDVGSVAIEYSTDPAFTTASTTPILTSRVDQDNALKFLLAGLLSSRRYYYRVVDGDGTTLSRVQSFTTFPKVGTDSALTVFFGSCQQARENDTGAVFEVAAALGGDLFVHLGDWTYPDLSIPDYPRTETSLRATWLKRLDTAYPFPGRLLAGMSLAYEWDDHDAYGSNSDGTIHDSVKTRVAQAYRRYTPHAPLASTVGIWHSFRAGNVEIFMLDDRTYRSPVDEAFDGNRFSPPAGHSMLAGGAFAVSGQNQMDWFMQSVRTSTARWKIIASPLPFNPAMGQMIPLALILGRQDVAKRFAEECWSGYPADVDSIRKLIGEGHLRNALIISGSAHTNMFDDGTHSLIPEFVAANLDQENSGLYDSLEAYGLRIWTAGQAGSESTIGRIRVETTPRHRLVVESFGESGSKLLELVVEEKPSSVLPIDAARGRDLRVSRWHDRLHLESDLAAGVASIRLFTIDGREVGVSTVVVDDRGAMDWDLPKSVAPGPYVGRVEKDGTALPFSLVR